MFHMAHKSLSKSIFIEGLQGAGKSTLVNSLSQKYPNYKVYREGDYSPVDLAWCAYVDSTIYQHILTKYEVLQDEIRKCVIEEDEFFVIPYTQILTDVPGFHKDLEQYEIYNGNLERKTFEEVILSRYRKWTGESEIFECAIFQNILENMMLYLQMNDEEIMAFYQRLYRAIYPKKIKIIYLDVENLQESVENIKKERSDENGVELWFPMMVKYVEESPYGKRNGLSGMVGLLSHLERRKALEHRIIKEVFFKETQILKSKSRLQDLVLAIVE